MRKTIMSAAPKAASAPDEEWLNIEQLASVEITSEDPEHPIESAILPGAILPGHDAGWRAQQPGEQTIRLIFDHPQRLSHIRLLFEESDVHRTQEFVLRWSADDGSSFREIVRQQWNFSPPDTIQELEDYRVELSGVTSLELTIVPDRNNGPARASLAELRLA
jgi:hypothetical protein